MKKKDEKVMRKEMQITLIGGGWRVRRWRGDLHLHRNTGVLEIDEFLFDSESSRLVSYLSELCYLKYNHQRIGMAKRQTIVIAPASCAKASSIAICFISHGLP